MLMFKKLVAAWAMPLPFALLLLAAGALVLRFSRRRRVGVAFLVAGVLVPYLAASGPVADALLGPLERRHPPVLDAADHVGDVAGVVVLGSGFRAAQGLPVTAQLSDDGQVRLVEGVRLHRQLDGAVPLVLSGGRVPGGDAASEGYRELALALGVDERSVRLLRTPRDTAEEAYAARELFGDGARVLLVTSASHMPRAVRHFRRAGLEPVPAPTGHAVIDRGVRGPGYWAPSASALRRTERALYEYMGLLAVGLEH